MHDLHCSSIRHVTMQLQIAIVMHDDGHDTKTLKAVLAPLIQRPIKILHKRNFGNGIHICVSWLQQVCRHRVKQLYSSWESSLRM